jgi:hypothetical protein
MDFPVVPTHKIDPIPKAPTYKIDPNIKIETEKLMNDVKQKTEAKKEQELKNVRAYNAAYMSVNSENKEKMNKLQNKSRELRNAEMVANRIEKQVNETYALPKPSPKKSRVARLMNWVTGKKKSPNKGGRRKTKKQKKNKPKK